MRRERGGDSTSLFGWMDRLFDEWLRSVPMRQPFGRDIEWPDDDLSRVDEFHDDNPRSCAPSWPASTRIATSRSR